MKKTSLYILSAAALLSLASCGKDFLEKAPVLSTSNELSLSTYEGLDKAVAGAYGYLASNSWFGASRVVEFEMRAGNGMKQEYLNSGRCTQGYNWNYTEDSTYGSIWANCYYMASAVNNVIDALDPSKGSEQELNNLKAECLFLRAFGHFENVLAFGQPYTYKKESLGVPYVYHTEASARPARETVEAVYTKVVEDLLEAEKIIDPAYYRTTGADKLAYANIHSIRALLSRVYLYMGEYQKAADYATKVIESGKFKMWEAKEYNSVWDQELGSGEVIYEIYGKRSNSTYASWEDISYLTNPAGSGDPVATPSLLALYEEGDVRGESYRTDEKGESGYWWTTKYTGKGDNAAPDCNNVIVFRLSEMYLTRAEAAVRGAQTGSTAVKDINEVVTRRGCDPYTSVGMADIKLERRKEFAWEGHRFYDLARWGDPLVRADEDFILGSMNQNVEFPSYRWALPIPKRELEVNENLVQNEGYTTK